MPIQDQQSYQVARPPAQHSTTGTLRPRAIAENRGKLQVGLVGHSCLPGPIGAESNLDLDPDSE